jgi:hypothetical protein
MTIPIEKCGARSNDRQRLDNRKCYMKHQFSNISLSPAHNYHHNRIYMDNTPASSSAKHPIQEKN